MPNLIIRFGTCKVRRLKRALATSFVDKEQNLRAIPNGIGRTFFVISSTFNPIIYCWKITEVRNGLKEKILKFNCFAARDYHARDATLYKQKSTNRVDVQFNMQSGNAAELAADT